MLDALRTIMEGILNLATHGGALVLIVAALLAFILLTAWFDRHDGADQPSPPDARRRRSRPRGQSPRNETGDPGIG